MPLLFLPKSYLLVIRFPSYAAALAFYDSPQYRKARQVREGAGVFNMVCVEGVEGVEGV